MRGRIGRGVLEGTCVLLYQSPVSDIAKKRLQVIYEVRDGFKVAEQDLRLRGPGEFVGVKQSGLPVLRFAELDKDKDLLEMAISVANHIIDNHSEIIDPHVSRWLGSKLPYLEA